MTKLNVQSFASYVNEGKKTAELDELLKHLADNNIIYGNDFKLTSDKKSFKASSKEIANAIDKALADTKFKAEIRGQELTITVGDEMILESLAVVSANSRIGILAAESKKSLDEVINESRDLRDASLATTIFWSDNYVNEGADIIPPPNPNGNQPEEKDVEVPQAQQDLVKSIETIGTIVGVDGYDDIALQVNLLAQRVSDRAKEANAPVNEDMHQIDPRLRSRIVVALNNAGIRNTKDYNYVGKNFIAKDLATAELMSDALADSYIVTYDDKKDKDVLVRINESMVTESYPSIVDVFASMKKSKRASWITWLRALANFGMSKAQLIDFVKKCGYRPSKAEEIVNFNIDGDIENTLDRVLANTDISMAGINTDGKVIEVIKDEEINEAAESVFESNESYVLESIYGDIDNKTLYADVICLNSEGKFLMVKRGTTTKVEPEKWGLPGGKVKLSEPTDIAALRELFEESGILSDDAKLIDILDNTDGSISNVYLVTVDMPEVTLTKEHTEYKWCTPDEMLNLDLMFNGGNRYNQLVSKAMMDLNAKFVLEAKAADYVGQTVMLSMPKSKNGMVYVVQSVSNGVVFASPESGDDEQMTEKEFLVRFQFVNEGADAGVGNVTMGDDPGTLDEFGNAITGTADGVSTNPKLKYVTEDGKEISTDAEFKDYAENLLKQAHQDDFDQAIADKTIKDLSDKYTNDYGAMLGALQAGLGN